MLEILDATTRVALAAFLHDLGKLAQRAKIEDHGVLDSHLAIYCPKRDNRNAWSSYTHQHAAYTAIAWDVLEATGNFPDLRKKCEPFKVAEADGNLSDSAINAAAAHHTPDSFLQWVVATADRVASGFERDEFDQADGYNNAKDREDFRRARLITLFEQIYTEKTEEGQLSYRYPLEPLSPQSLFPQKKETCTPVNEDEAVKQYRKLWEYLLQEIKKIPASHTANLPLWLDHFDSLWLSVTHAIPSATPFGQKRIKPEVSLYDHSKTTAALASALWRWHHDCQLETAVSLKSSWDEQKFLLIQGDFFGIQNFIFAEGGQTNKQSQKLLRGRSFQVALLAECAALKLLEALELPPTSQIINAAGKFLIVAPNTPTAKEVMNQVRDEFNDWCLKQTYGEIGIGLASTEASCNDFSQGRFGDLVKKLFEALDVAKHRRFNLCDTSTTIVFNGFLDQFSTNGVCQINGRYPANSNSSQERDYALCQLADDQIRIGEALTKKARVLISKGTSNLPNLTLDYFGWHVAFVQEQDATGKYGQLAHERKLIRCWDFDQPEADGSVFRGYARRFVNTYVPRWNDGDRTLMAHNKYERLSKDEIGNFDNDQIKTLHVLAVEDGNNKDNSKKWRGEIALLTLKGDVDNLGMLFQQGLKKPTFAKWSSLSRQMNLFFALWLPWFCEHGKDKTAVARYRNTYTVFAGGDDFFLIGPWQSTIQLAGEIREHFNAYVVNGGITLSAGMVMTQPKVPARQLARSADMGLAKAKSYVEKPSTSPTKNAVTLWSQTVSWDDWETLMQECYENLNSLIKRAEENGSSLSTGMIYSLLELANKAGRELTSKRPEDSLWRSQLAYRTVRLVKDKQLASALNVEIAEALLKYRGAYRLPLSMLLYGKRE